jgi:T4 superinfection immunity protein
MNSFIGPALIGWVSTLAISVGVSLIVAGALAVWSGRLLGLAPEHKLWAFIVGFAFLCSLSTVSISEPGTWSDTLFVAMLPIWAILIYFLPSVAAIYGGQPNLNGIFFMNLLFGWTIAGWVVAFFFPAGFSDPHFEQRIEAPRQQATQRFSITQCRHPTTGPE